MCGFFVGTGVWEKVKRNRCLCPGNLLSNGLFPTRRLPNLATAGFSPANMAANIGVYLWFLQYHINFGRKHMFFAHPNFTVIQWTESHYCNCGSTLNIQLQVHLVFRRLSQWLPPKAQDDIITMFQCFQWISLKETVQKQTCFYHKTNVTVNCGHSTKSGKIGRDCLKNMDMMQHFLWDWHGTFCGFI